MKVLDVGSGAGDVALLLADRVGPSGKVVGVEIDPTVLETASARVEATRHTNVSFLVGDIATLPLETEFDAIVGRLIFIHLPSRAAVLHRLVSHLRPGGIVAFQELDMVHPPNRLIQHVFTWMLEAFCRAGLPVRMGLDLYPVFLDAGLPAPSMSGEATMIAGPEWVGH